MPFTPAMGNILIVDDDPNICELLQVNLRSEGYAVDVRPVAEQIDFDSLRTTQLVIVDAMQQPYGGMDLIFDLKDNSATEHIGIILYSNIKSERIVIDALDAGADDYIVKPFSLREMVARVKSVMRRHRVPARSAAVISFESLEVDLNSQTTRIDGKPVALTKTEFSILALLLKNVNTYVSRVEIHRSVWADDTAGVNERIVDTNISRLRKKLGDVGSHITNRSGHGYMIS